jgi:hypothetical protein
MSDQRFIASATGIKMKFWHFGLGDPVGQFEDNATEVFCDKLSLLKFDGAAEFSASTADHLWRLTEREIISNEPIKNVVCPDCYTRLKRYRDLIGALADLVS